MLSTETAVLERLIEVSWNRCERTWSVRWLVEGSRASGKTKFFVMRWSVDQLNTPAKAAKRFCQLNRRELVEEGTNGAGEQAARGYVSLVDGEGVPSSWIFVASEAPTPSVNRFDYRRFR